MKRGFESYSINYYVYIFNFINPFKTFKNPKMFRGWRIRAKITVAVTTVQNTLLLYQFIRYFIYG